MMTIKQILKKVTKEYLISVTNEMTKTMGLEDGEGNTEDMTKKNLLEMIISDGGMITKDDSFCDETWDFLISVGLENAIKFSPVSDKEEVPEPELDEVIEDSNPPLDDDGIIEEVEPEVEEVEKDDKPPFIDTVPVPKKADKKTTRRQVTGMALADRPKTRDEFTQAIDDLYVSLNDKPSNMKESSYFSKITLQILEGAKMVSVNNGDIEYLI